ncbi:7,8-didemethyl-8-hydroxy-5-deazariboflavin synthase subunit CofH [Spirulina subsalsa FACHB-351]|uniref:5-amino-6-(D-ribitylamino)uracil--L-tyrosine 4-hydroxyphenyl transferase n=1 Tax=Spirulina subsalsa FACHB-351 TaxID=234711 RepID=A0ABT3KZR9_9CYAN|nr:7,8-didemethyl-8-hydroxy-5-deazariboflavin synthase subunit CofH [Spirulina subsalsa]MCW6034746.1 7,8-didemethyl-8-hydroxy-5-deazariboflavin synthase subunit CofH [Spirulina subsalsa FACHB-351]
MKLIEQLLNRVCDGYDLTPEEGVLLLQQTDPVVVEKIRETSDRLRQEQVGETVTYVVNRNINYTNICEQHCNFCAFRRDEGEEGAYWLGWEQIRAKAEEAVRGGASEICMQGGLNPAAKLNGSSLAYYLRLVETIKQDFPQLHIHAFSPQEVQFIAREDGLSLREVIVALRGGGVGSLPGTAAEVLDDRVRRVICPEKIDTATWLDVVETALEEGLPTTSTLMCGHIETPMEQIHHLELLRQLQEKAIAHHYPARITEFILLPFVGQFAPVPLRRRVGRDQPVLEEVLRLTAVARIYLGRWIVNHQPSWVKLGLKGATEALKWGCNDLGGTLMEEHITSMAGAQGGTSLTVEELRNAIASLHRPALERTTLYQSRPLLTAHYLGQSNHDGINGIDQVSPRL